MVLTGQTTQREAAAKWKVDRCTVTHICRTVKQGTLDALDASVPGQPGQSACEAALARAQAEAGRLCATVTKQAVALHLQERKLGLTAGPVPARVGASVKAGLPGLAGHAAGHGWPVRRAGFLGLDHARYRYHYWLARRDAGRLEDEQPGGNPLHGLPGWERAAIVELFESWAETDRSHRKLAHRC